MKTTKSNPLPQISKFKTGISGLDDITFGGLPQGRPTLVYGSAGSGKTLLGMEFLVHGAIEENEPGVFMSFEETEDELITNVGSLGFDVKSLIASKKLFIDYVSVERSEIEETGEYDLEGLFVRLNSAIDFIGAKRVVLDTIEVLYAGLSNKGIIRAELRRLFKWLKEKGVTTIVTGERGESGLTRHGLEEYVSDCVILLDNRVTNGLSTRRLRIIKYRGSAHNSNEVPFIIDDDGISMMPVSTIKLDYLATTERVSTGIEKLDVMLGGKGYLKGSAILISGNVGTGKSSLAAHFVAAGCGQKHRCLYFAFEESSSQIIRNMRSIGIELEPFVKSGLLQFHSMRVTEQSLEKHLITMQKAIAAFKPEQVVVDAIDGFTNMGDFSETRQMVLRLLDIFKKNNITALCTSMASQSEMGDSGVGLSSVFDTWIDLSNVQSNMERTRTLVIVKSRGMAHSNQVREFILTGKGANLLDIYNNVDGAFMGSARETQMAADKALEAARLEKISVLEHQIKQKKHILDARIAAMQAEFELEAKEVEMSILWEKELEQSQLDMNKSAKRSRIHKK